MRSHPFFQPALTGPPLTGQAVKKPTAMASRISSQYDAVAFAGPGGKRVSW
ncbi:hypothetical protein ABZT04_42355 [Streptomyces sp. NPDC005492]|uniref:hypothetical protein n=1 Tax=Streptomyces sp. NPDC005492 TaxID=3156883 RepID=UPI0033A33581